MSCGAGDEFAQALHSAIFVNFRGAVAVENMVSRPWASIAFSGTRHSFTLRLAGDGARAAAADFLARLDEYDFGLRRHVVVDIAATGPLSEVGEEVCLPLEALTVAMD